MEATDMSFFLSTGLGDGFGVCVGHAIYVAGKKAVTGNADISLAKELQVGIMLGSAAVCSGGIWQVSCFRIWQMLRVEISISTDSIL